MALRGIVPAVFMGVITILVIAVTFSFLSSLLLAFTSLHEGSLNWAINIIAFIAMFMGGAVSGAKAKQRGWIVGALTALVFTFLTILVQFLGYDRSFTIQQYGFHAGYLLTAIIGGMIGVNLSSHRQS
ncbi:TIGR04086 family membrane protein [Halalkalibacterium ligniniphilum]|uniref:TIGR04086 family membrane protein n=1 Tax=Halalkalibacterium ligniniphilum TaxID=1134413 RepID=UPI000346277F|nr:TIGR04086 family membrane protein [Halalkalibacterium ligniniphilum]